MQLWEIYFLVNEIPYVDKTQWETCRILALFIAQKFCKKRLKLKDIFTLPSEQEHHYELTEEEIEQNKELQQKMADYLNQQQDEINI